MRTVIFDLDGTLADTSGDLIASANVCFEGLGYGAVLDPVRDAATAFAGGRAMLRLGLSRKGIADETLIDAQFPILLDAYAANIDRYTVLYPGVIDAIERLRGAGTAVGICTNKPEALAEMLMTRLGVRHMFGALVGADTLPVRKPDAAPLIETVQRLGGTVAQSVLIGDTMTDRETARAAGMPSVLVTFGPDGRDVAALNPDALLDHYDDLDIVLTTLLG